MSTDDTRPLPAADDETPTRAIDAVAAEDRVTADEPVRVRADEPVQPGEDDGTVEQSTSDVRTETTDLPGATATDAPPSPAPEPVRATPVPAVPVPPSTAAQPPAPRPPTPAGPELRVGTVVWGLVVAVVGIGIISFAWGARIDGGLALIVLLAGAGVALLVGSLVVGARRPGRRGTGG